MALTELLMERMRSLALGRGRFLSRAEIPLVLVPGGYRVMGSTDCIVRAPAIYSRVTFLRQLIEQTIASN
ncbi:Chymotrypsinogen B [Triplophysa tibetana]|uniref:Chymotrypsinogen B n=1 Tax=Triplophysa tibetana TaxID=1572043 RepID=A0A5A9MZ05_9TELE|nr:Chymotrypsinogen B [Triplophysa tibetana]